jgi:hypothetical protein
MQWIIAAVAELVTSNGRWPGRFLAPLASRLRTVAKRRSRGRVGDLERLPPDDQRVARALFEARRAAGAPARLTIDHIAARRRYYGASWREVFWYMKARGFVAEESLAEVIRKYGVAGDALRGTTSVRMASPTLLPDARSMASAPGPLRRAM